MRLICCTADRNRKKNMYGLDCLQSFPISCALSWRVKLKFGKKIIICGDQMMGSGMYVGALTLTLSSSLALHRGALGEGAVWSRWIFLIFDWRYRCCHQTSWIALGWTQLIQRSKHFYIIDHRLRWSVYEFMPGGAHTVSQGRSQPIITPLRDFFCMNLTQSALDAGEW